MQKLESLFSPAPASSTNMPIQGWNPFLYISFLAENPFISISLALNK